MGPPSNAVKPRISAGGATIADSPVPISRSSVASSAVKNMVKINYWGRGKFDIPALNAMLDGLRAQGSWKGPIDWKDILDDSFLPKDQQGM